MQYLVQQAMIFFLIYFFAFTSRFGFNFYLLIYF